MIVSGWACEPILVDEVEEEPCWENLGKGFLASKEITWEMMPPSSSTKNYHAWTCSSHFGAMRGAHVEAKPSAEGGRAERRNLGPQEPPEAVVCIMPRALPNSGDVQYTIMSLFHLVPIKIVLLAAQILAS